MPPPSLTNRTSAASLGFLRDLLVAALPSPSSLGNFMVEVLDEDKGLLVVADVLKGRSRRLV